MFCPNCGKEYFENQNFCRFCGAKLNENYISSSETSETSETTKQEEQTSLKTEQNENSSEETTVFEANGETPQQEQIETPAENQNNEEEPPATLSDETKGNNNSQKRENLFQSIKNSLIFEKNGEKHLTPSAMTLLVVLLLFVIFMANILLSINDAIQINPSMTNENALMSIPNENEDGEYTQAPEPKQEEEISEENSEEEEQHEFAEQKTEEPPIVPIEEIRQMEQQFPEPEIPMPQDLQDEDIN